MIDNSTSLVQTCTPLELLIYPMQDVGATQPYDVLLSDSFLYIDIYENLFSYFLTAELLIKDTQDIINSYEIKGGESVTFKFIDTTLQQLVQLEFIIYKYTTGKRTEGETAQRVKFIQFFLVSPEGLDSINRKISKVFKGTIDDIIKNQIFKNPKLMPTGLDKTIDTGTPPTKFSTTLSIISNFWCPSEIINFATNITDPYDVVFYQTLNGDQKYHLKRIEDLLKSNDNRENLYYVKNLNLPNYTDWISRIEHATKADLTELVEDGGFGGTYYKWNETNNIITKKAITYRDTIFATLGNSYIIPISLQDSTSDYRQSFFNINTSSYRNILLGTIDNTHSLVMLSGKVREVGKLINMVYYNDDGTLRPHKLFSGSWMITEIKHSITNTRLFYQTVKLIKNAFNDTTSDHITATTLPPTQILNMANVPIIEESIIG